MKKNKSLDNTKTHWRSKSKNCVMATSWYNSGFQEQSIASLNKISSLSVKSTSTHKFRSRYVPSYLTIKQNKITDSSSSLMKSKSILAAPVNQQIYLSQDKLLKIFYRRIQSQRSTLLQRQMIKLRTQLPKVKNYPKQKQLLVVEDFLKKMNFFRELKEDELFKQKLYSDLINS